MKLVFQDRLQQSIESRGLTQRMLATLTGTSEQNICRYLRGNRLPGADILYRMCKALDVSADYLLGLSETPENNIDAVKAKLLYEIRKVLY